MKRMIALALCLCMAVCAMTGCDTEEKVTTDGSTSMEKVVIILGEVFEEDTGVSVTYNPTGSSAGISAVAEGTCDIGLASRDLKESEIQQGLQGTVVAIDGIAIIVNPENPVQDLTLEQIAGLYNGTITNWSEVGGNDAAVVRIGREAASGTRDGFESITGTEDSCKYDQELTSTGDVVATVAANPNAIGYASVASVKETVKAVTVDGVAATNETVQNGSYPVQRNFVLVTRTGEALSENAQAFFEFATSAAADKYIEQAGAVPVIH